MTGSKGVIVAVGEGAVVSRALELLRNADYVMRFVTLASFVPRGSMEALGCCWSRRGLSPRTGRSSGRLSTMWVNYTANGYTENVQPKSKVSTDDD